MNRRFLLALVPPLAAGAAVRLWGLGSQLLIGDELHAVVSVLDWDLAGILTTFRNADPCIPLAAFFRVLSDLGVPLTEGLLRAPSVAAGLAAIAVLPCLARPELPARRWRVLIVFAWLLALSPLLIFYGRIARPYAVIVLLGGCALAFGWRFLEGRGRRWAAAYVVTAALSVWFHLVTAPFVAVPLAFAAAEVVVAHRTGRPRLGAPSWGEIMASAAGLAGLVGAFLLPGAPSFLRLWRAKQAQSLPDLSTLAGVATLQAGVVAAWAAPLFWALAAIGVVSLLRQRPRLTAFALTALGAQWLAVMLVLRPAGVALPLVLNRYVLVAYPLVLFAVAHGIAALWRFGWRDAHPRHPGTRAVPWRRLAPAGVAGILAIVIAGHPYLRDPALRFGPFGASNSAVEFTGSPPRLPADAVPRVYRILGQEHDRGAVAEAASGLASFELALQQATWRIHGRTVLIAGTPHWLLDADAERRLAFRHLVPARPSAIEASAARWMVIHTDRPQAVRRPPPVRGKRPRPPGGAARAGTSAADRPLAASLTESWGEPDLTGDGLVAWDLDRVRSRRRQAQALRK